MNIIEIQGLHKIYDEKSFPVHALNGIDLKIEAGEFIAVVGPSGSGKTTLFNMIGGLDEPTRGRVIIDQIEMTAMSERQKTNFRLRHVGFVFQSYNLIPVFTAKENVEFIMQLQKVGKQEREQRTLELMQAIGLTDKINCRPAKMSGGEQQRVAVARALAAKPRFVLADEPTANLDSVSANRLLEIMEKLNLIEKITFIFATHDPRVVSKARRVITIQDGHVVSDVSK